MNAKPPSASVSVLSRWMGIGEANVGELMTVKATVNAAWRSSMEADVRVEFENVRTGAVTHTSAAYLTTVALDDEGRTTEVPGVKPEAADEQRRAREAQLHRENRLAEPERIEADRAGD